MRTGRYASATRTPHQCRLLGRACAWVVALCAIGVTSSQGQSFQNLPSLQPRWDLASDASFLGEPASSPADAPAPAVGQAAWTSGCANCESPTYDLTSGLPTLDMGCSTCSSCCDGLCVPGQPACAPCNANTRVGRFLCEIYRALCCPDLCYDPKWTPLADSAFFVEAVRPVTQQRIRWDAGMNMFYPDRAEYFWARADGSGRGPSVTAPWRGVRSVDYSELSLYTETSSGKFSAFINQPYRSVDPSDAAHGAGFGAMDIGTKTLLFDCELLQISMQFRTYMPMGSASKGLGNGHLSLEPSLLIGLSLSPNTYLQGQISEWIPIAGNSTYSGAILHYHVSVNRVWFRPLPDVPVIVTGEVNGWSFQDGAYTDPVLGTQPASGTTYLSIGPGIRMTVCDKIDFGVGSALALTNEHFAETLIRSEFRWRY